MAELPARHRGVLALDPAVVVAVPGPRAGELDLQLLQQPDGGVVDELQAVVGMQAEDHERKGLLQHEAQPRLHERASQGRHGHHRFPLGHLVDDIDVEHPLTVSQPHRSRRSPWCRCRCAGSRAAPSGCGRRRSPMAGALTDWVDWTRRFRREAEFDWTHELEVKVLGENRSRVRTAATKDLNRIVDQELAHPRHVPPPDHPWRKMDQMAAALAEVRNARADSSAGVNP